MKTLLEIVSAGVEWFKNCVRRLIDQVVNWLGTPDTPGSFYHGMRLTAVDGFVLDVPDTTQNERAFGRPQSGRAAGAFPQVRCVSTPPSTIPRVRDAARSTVC